MIKIKIYVFGRKMYLLLDFGLLDLKNDYLEN